MYALARMIIEQKFGSINKMSKVIGVEACDLYAGFKGSKTLYPKYKRLIAEALEVDEEALFPEDGKTARPTDAEHAADLQDGSR